MGEEDSEVIAQIVEESECKRKLERVVKEQEDEIEIMKSEIKRYKRTSLNMEEELKDLRDKNRTLRDLKTEKLRRGRE